MSTGGICRENGKQIREKTDMLINVAAVNMVFIHQFDRFFTRYPVQNFDGASFTNCTLNLPR